MITGDKSIAFLIPSIEYGGAELQVINQINFLVKKKVQVFLIVIDKINTLRDEINLASDHIFELGFPVHASYSKAILKAPIIAGRVWQLIRQYDLQIVLANLPICHYIGRLAKMRSFINRGTFKLINYHHSLQYIESPLDTSLKKFFNYFNSLLARVVDDKNIFISEASKQNGQEHFYMKDPVVIFNSIPFKKPDRILALEYLENNNIVLPEFMMVLPGRIQKAKGQIFFIQVLTRFIQSNGLSSGQVKVIFAGGGDQEEEISQLIFSNNLQDFIHITGFVPNDLLLSFLEVCDLVVIPSIFEGFGNVALEALMVNKLILASDAGGLKEIIQDKENGFQFQSLDADGFFEKLNFIYCNRNKELISKDKLAADFQTRFSFESHMRKLIQEINSCVE